MKSKPITEDELKVLLKEKGWATEFGWWYKIGEEYYTVENKEVPQ